MKIRFETIFVTKDMEELPEFINIDEHAVLYRTVFEGSDPLRAEYDPVTAKTGCYFSLIHPCLADARAIKINEPVVRYKFTPTEPIRLLVGRDANADYEQDMSHYDPSVNSKYIDTREIVKAEVFLIPEDLDKLREEGSEIITPIEISRQYEVIEYNLDIGETMRNITEYIYYLVNRGVEATDFISELEYYLINNINLNNLTITREQFIQNVSEMVMDYARDGAPIDQIADYLVQMVREMLMDARPPQPPPPPAERPRLTRGMTPYRRIAG